jgi:hypothetical protein
MKTLQMLTCALGLSLAAVVPVMTHAADTNGHVDCSQQGTDLSKMTPEQREKMQAACRDEKQHMDCGKDGMDMSKMTAEQRDALQAHCAQTHDSKSNMHSEKHEEGSGDDATNSTNSNQGTTHGNSHGHAGGASL